MKYLNYIVQGIALALLAGMGAGFGAQLYTSGGGFMYSKGLPPGGPWSQMFGLGMFGLLEFLPLEALTVLLWVFVRARFSKVVMSIYYLPTAYAVGLAVGLIVGGMGWSPTVNV